MKQEQKGIQEMKESQEKDLRTTGIEQVEEAGADLEEDKLETTKRRRLSIGQEEDQMKMKGGMKHQEVEDLDQEVEGKEVEQKDLTKLIRSDRPQGLTFF